ncbi:hypothetical protein [Macrococcus brunensis]|uniref:hypothetical protein n=1 Tax=Macrococcus brunensis TaxID=198483 RepID=UPI001EF1117B|nr:hypothetical protein [Macrococcus brunensis]ULG72995.1 hypothetical protein MGG12_05620 [Macrococcus brunensis]
MKHTVKKQVNLHELIQWAWGNGAEKQVRYTANGGGYVSFGLHGEINQIKDVFPGHKFTIEVEEEITEETIFEKVVVIERDINGNFNSYVVSNASVSRVLTNIIRPHFIYLQNPDGSIGTLIWTKEKGLIES